MRPLSRTIRPELVAVAALLAAATALFWTTRLDLVAGDLFREGCCAWPLAERQPWSFIYKYGVLLGVLLAAGALVTLTLSYWYPARLHAWRRPALFLVLVAALGPGLVVNVVCKDRWGRPRPREVVELGGQERFLPVWVKGSEPQAKSFPCGHCAMGFYLSVPWLVLKRRRRRTALAFLAAGLVWGGLLGAARMMAGGHFLSDVVWAGGMVWLVALALHHVMELDREPAPSPAGATVDRRRARLATALGGGALALLTVAVLLATPYVSSKSTGLTPAQLSASPAAALEVDLDDATVAVEAGPALDVAYDVQAFGFPTSKLNFGWRDVAGAAVLTIDPLGWFTERRMTVRLRLPAGGEKALRLKVGRGKVGLDLRGFSPATRLDVAVGDGELRVTGGEALEAAGQVHLSVGRGAVVRAR